MMPLTISHMARSKLTPEQTNLLNEILEVRQPMNDPEVSKKLTWMIGLLTANLLAIVGVGGAMVLGLLPKVERAVQTTERVEARLQTFADKVQPVLTAGAGKATEAIKKIDAEKLSQTATEKTNALMDAAAERAKRFLERDKNKK
jgi:hypothetical protein